MRSSIRLRSSSRSARAAGGGIGLAVGASQMDGMRAPFSNTGSYVSLAAPGSNVFAAESADSDWPRAETPVAVARVLRLGEWHLLRGAPGGGSGRARLGREPRAVGSPGGAGSSRRPLAATTWNSQLGWGRLDVGAAVELATRASPWERRALLKPRRF